MYFDFCTSPENVKTTWRKLCFEHHPDRGGDVRIMQDVNVEYHSALNRFDGFSATGTDGKPHTYHYNKDVEQEIMDKVQELLKLHLDGCQIMLIGTWIWIGGETYEFRTVLAEAGCKWHSRRKKWYWRRAQDWRRHSSDASLDTLAAVYGYQEFSSEDEEKDKKAVAV